MWDESYRLENLFSFVVNELGRFLIGYVYRLEVLGAARAKKKWGNHERSEMHSVLVRKELAPFLIFFHQRLEMAVTSD